jgi:hypothetical protein
MSVISKAYPQLTKGIHVADVLILTTTGYAGENVFLFAVAKKQCVPTKLLFS